MFDLKNKKVLLVGLGRLGGGLATAKFLIKEGSILTITDQRREEELSRSLENLREENIKFVLGEHREEDFKNNDVIVFNPAVYRQSPWVKLAIESGKQVENDLTLFLKFLGNSQKYISVTGTRGKTTTTTWIGHLLNSSMVGGNMPDQGLLWLAKQISSNSDPIVLELSSFQLEFVDEGMLGPKVAVITNLSPDHLNRYGSMEKYAKAKAGIFMNQTEKDFLVLNLDDPNHKLFLEQKPKSQIFYLSLNELPKDLKGIFVKNNTVYFKDREVLEISEVPLDFADHQKYNLIASMLSAYLYVQDWKDITSRINTLPQIKFREEVIFKDNSLTIINDSAATSPQGVIVALEKFKNYKDHLVLISGGTDKDLEFKKLSEKIKDLILPGNLYLLEGSATSKLIILLDSLGYKGFKVYASLEEILTTIKNKILGKENWLVLFSPGAASFEKFKHEFDRGEKFNEAVKRTFG